jgi:ATP phosphoribosyltransferase
MRRRRMNAPLILAVPSKGRLQQNAEAFFARSGLELVKPRGARDYRGTIAGLDGVEVAYLSASEITTQLALGAVHLGVTGEDLVREMIPNADRQVVLIDPLGFGFANVVVAVPRAWIDVRNMADLDDVATAFRLKHERKMRLATKYANLTRGFFAEHGVVDYRIVESSGATEGAPAAGTAELIVDITTTGTTLAANALKVIDDGLILRSQANLVAARAASWGAAERETARLVLDRIAAQARARAFREVRTRFARCDEALLALAKTRFGVETPFGGPTSSGMLTLHCPPKYVHALASFLREHGAEAVSVAALDYVYSRDNPLYAKLAAELERSELHRGESGTAQ